METIDLTWDGFKRRGLQD